MMILHLFPNEKFTIDYVKRINSLFESKEHFFFVYNNRTQICSSVELPFENVFFGEIRNGNKKIESLLKKADRIVLHGMWFDIISLMYLYRKIKKYSIKTVWAVWGGDFYNAYKINNNSKNVARRFKELYRRKLIASLYGIDSSCDYEKVVSVYKTNAKQFDAPYSYRLIEAVDSEHNDIVNIMVGHSATDNCRHIEVFERIKEFAGKIKVYCPLSYPDNTEYKQEIIDKGKEYFGDDFVPMLDFMKYDEYVCFLNSIDIGIFYNDRQQGNGNIVNLLYLGKKIYMSHENTLFERYAKLGAELFDFEKMDPETFLNLSSDAIKAKNKEVILSIYSDEAFYTSWNKVFTE